MPRFLPSYRAAVQLRGIPDPKAQIVFGLSLTETQLGNEPNAPCAVTFSELRYDA
jgi:hypothetical protein